MERKKEMMCIENDTKYLIFVRVCGITLEIIQIPNIFVFREKVNELKEQKKQFSVFKFYGERKV